MGVMTKKKQKKRVDQYRVFQSWSQKVRARFRTQKPKTPHPVRLRLFNDKIMTIDLNPRLWSHRLNMFDELVVARPKKLTAFSWPAYFI